MAFRNYYYLVAGLPDLSIDQGKLQFGSVELREHLKTVLHEKDYMLIEWLFLPFDNQNLINLLNKSSKDWITAGIYPKDTLELAITEVKNPDKLSFDEKSDVKPYLKEFIRIKLNNDILTEVSDENILWGLYFRDALKIKNDFLRNWFEFELNLKNLLVFSNAQLFNIPYENQLVGDTNFVKSLKEKTGRDMGSAIEWPYYDKVIQLVETTDITLREKGIDHLRWLVLDEMNIFNYFSIEVIISYMVKIIIIERWLKLDPKTGEELFRRLLGDLQSGYEFPNEFSVNDGKK